MPCSADPRPAPPPHPSQPAPQTTPGSPKLSDPRLQPQAPHSVRRMPGRLRACMAGCNRPNRRAGALGRTTTSICWSQQWQPERSGPGSGAGLGLWQGCCSRGKHFLSCNCSHSLSPSCSAPWQWWKSRGPYNSTWTFPAPAPESLSPHLQHAMGGREARPAGGGACGWPSAGPGAWGRRQGGFKGSEAHGWLECWWFPLHMLCA